MESLNHMWGNKYADHMFITLACNCNRLCARLPHIASAESSVSSTVSRSSSTSSPPVPDAQPPSDNRVALISALSPLIQRNLQAFRPPHFAQCAAGLASSGLRPNAALWRTLARAAQRRLPSFLLPELAALSASIAVAGYVPSLDWVTACEKQALKHMGGEGCSGEALSALVWSWGAFSHTPSKRVMDGVKMELREMMKVHALGPGHLLQARCLSIKSSHQSTEGGLFHS